jgi:preprotein translocase subunit SecE
MSVAKKENTSLLKRIARLYRGVLTELKKVHWPNRKEVSTYTLVVLASVAIVGVLIWLVDSGISFLMSLLIQ